MFENGNTVPCSMAARQGTGGGLEDPFGMATKFQAKLAEEEERRKRMAEQGGPAEHHEDTMKNQ